MDLMQTLSAAIGEAAKAEVNKLMQSDEGQRFIADACAANAPRPDPLGDALAAYLGNPAGAAKIDAILEEMIEDNESFPQSMAALETVADRAITKAVEEYDFGNPAGAAKIDAILEEMIEDNESFPQSMAALETVADRAITKAVEEYDFGDDISAAVNNFDFGGAVANWAESRDGRASIGEAFDEWADDEDNQEKIIGKIGDVADHAVAAALPTALESYLATAAGRAAIVNAIVQALKLPGAPAPAELDAMLAARQAAQ